MHRVGAYPPLLSRVPVARQGRQCACGDGLVFQSERFGQPTLERLRFPAASASSRQEQLQRRQARFRRRGEETGDDQRSEEHTSELQSPCNLVCRLLLEKKKKKNT